MIFLLAFITQEIFCQTDSVQIPVREDSSEINGRILEQSPVEEDSPILDEIEFPDSKLNNYPFISFRSRFIQSLQQSKGFTDEKYLGTRVKLYQRLKINNGGHLNGGILFEKDAGEQRFNDFTAGNLTISNVSIIKKIILGDYIAEAGQGVVLWRGYDFSKGAEVVLPAKKEGRGVVPYVSSDEINFFRGIALEFQVSDFDAFIFYSKKQRTASTDSSDVITSFTVSGYFRTEHEIGVRNNVSEKIFGGHASFQFSKDNEIGLTGYRSDLSNILTVDNGRKFLGDNYSVFALDYHLRFQRMTFFGEWSRGVNTMGGNSGMLLQPIKSVDLIAVYRCYPYEFFSLHGLGFGERATTSNETGLYLGMRMRIGRWLKIMSYVDQYRFPRPTSSVVFPSNGNDFLFHTEWNIIPKTEFQVRYQRKISEEKTSARNEYGFSNAVHDNVSAQHVRLHLEYRLNSSVNIRSRIEHVDVHWNRSGKKEKGLAVYQDMKIKQTEKLWWNTRVTFFQTDSYDSRMYEYENDLEGVSSLPGLYGRGVRWYILLHYKFAESFELSAKYADLIRDDVKHLGSGLDELPVNHDNRFSFQIDLSL